MTYEQLSPPVDGAFLYCEDCLAECSANPNDYFWAPPQRPIFCECGSLMVRMVRDVRLRRV